MRGIALYPRCVWGRAISQTVGPLALLEIRKRGHQPVGDCSFNRVGGDFPHFFPRSDREPPRKTTQLGGKSA